MRAALCRLVSRRTEAELGVGVAALLARRVGCRFSMAKRHAAGSPLPVVVYAALRPHCISLLEGQAL